MKSQPTFTLKSLLTITGLIAFAIAFPSLWRQHGDTILVTVLVLSVLTTIILFPFRSSKQMHYRSAFGTVIFSCVFALSFGPACWVYPRIGYDSASHERYARAFHFIYTPVARAIFTGPEPMRDAAILYVDSGMPIGTAIDREHPGFAWATRKTNGYPGYYRIEVIPFPRYHTQNHAIHVRTGNGLKTSGCESRLGNC